MLDSNNPQVWRHYISKALGVMAGNLNLTVDQAVARIEALKGDSDWAFLDHVPDESRIVDGRNFRQLRASLFKRNDAQDEISEAVAAMRADGDSWRLIALELGISPREAEATYGGSTKLSDLNFEELADRLEKGDYTTGPAISGDAVRHMQKAVDALRDAGASELFIRSMAGL